MTVVQLTVQAYRVDVRKDLFGVLEQQIIVDLGSQSQQVPESEILVYGLLNGAKLLQDQFVSDVGVSL